MVKFIFESSCVKKVSAESTNFFWTPTFFMSQAFTFLYFYGGRLGILIVNADSRVCSAVNDGGCCQ